MTLPLAAGQRPGPFVPALRLRHPGAQPAAVAGTRPGAAVRPSPSAASAVDPGGDPGRRGDANGCAGRLADHATLAVAGVSGTAAVRDDRDPGHGHDRVA